MRLSRYGWGASVLTLLGACGAVGLGGNPFLTDPVPVGQLRFQGQFQNCASGKAVSGTAQVYLTASGEVLRLESLSVLVDGAQPNAGLLEVESQYTSGMVCSIGCVIRCVF